MKQTANTQNSSNTRDNKNGHRLFGSGFIAVALACVLCVIFYLFARSYNSLRDAILLERIDYVEEISTQIITNQLFLEKEYSAMVTTLAEILETESVTSLESVQKYKSGKVEGDILMMSESNDLVDLSGRRISMPNNMLIQAMLNKTGVTRLFTSLNYKEDSWLFAVPISEKEIEGAVYKAVILSIPADEFKGNMTISLFDDRGASYIVGADGRIKIKPNNENLVFSGYNLFSSMISNGASPEDVAELAVDLRSGEAGSSLIRAGELDWLVGHTAIDDDNSIIVAVPLTLTAAQTYRGLNSTILLSALSVTVIALIAIAIIVMFFRRERYREREAMAVAAKSEFFSKMSHDIRTPLNAVIGLTTLANDDADDPNAVRDYLGQSLASARYLLAIINDVLEASRIESGKLILSAEPFDLNSMLEDVKTVTLSMLDDKELTFIDETGGPYENEYIGDEVRIKQILANLLSNATKYTKRGGTVGLRISRVSRADGYDVFTMAVTDDGIGMSEEFLSRIFTPFEQERSSYIQQQAGSGLGLSIVHELVKLMGGAIDVQSKLDEGSTFTVTLPLMRGKRIAAASPAQARETPSFNQRRILLAEDNEVNQSVTTKILSTRFGIKTDVAPDGVAAVNMFADSPPDTYDLILMDVKMPNMDGLEATRAIRALARPDAQSIPIVALSANAFVEDIELSLAAGMNEHLSKPIDAEAFEAVFKKYFM